MAFNDNDLFAKMMQASQGQEAKEDLFSAVNSVPKNLPQQQQQPQQDMMQQMQQPQQMQQQAPQGGRQLAPWAQFLEEHVNPKLRPINEAIEQNVVRPLRESPPGAALLGAMQGLHNTAASTANLALPENMQMQQLDTFGLTDPDYAALHGAGNIGGQIAGDVGLYGALSPIGKGASGLTRVIMEALKGAATGYAGGEFSPGGRETSAKFGGAVPFIAQAFNPAVAKMMGEDATALKGAFGKEYEEFSKQYGAVPANTRYSKAVDELRTGNRLTKNSSEPLNEFLQAPTVDNAHQALSALKAEQRGMLTKSHPTAASLPRDDKATYGLIGDAIDSVQSQMKRGLEKAGKGEGFDIYKELSERFKTEYAPYKFPELEAFLAQSPLGGSKGSAKGVTQGIHGMKDNAADVHRFFLSKYPELYLNKYMKQFGGGAALLGGAKTDTGQELLQALLSQRGEQ